MGHECLGTIIKLETRKANGEIKYETKCIPSGDTNDLFGELDCN